MSDTPPATLPLVGKSDTAFRTIGEVTAETGIAAHILRYWEAHFPQLRPVTRAGGRRYYRPDDIALVRRIDRLLNAEGYTLKGARAAIAGGGTTPPATANDALLAALRPIRDTLAAALREDERA